MTLGSLPNASMVAQPREKGNVGWGVVHRAARAPAVLLLALAVGLALVVVTPDPAPAAGRCPSPPLEVTILPGPVGTTGPTPFTVTDAVARRVPIVPRRASTTAGPDELRVLQERAAKTDLALFTVYLADFAVPRKELRGFGFGEVIAPEGRTVAAVTIVPTEKDGFAAGDVAEVAPFEYDATTTFAPMSVVVNSSGERSLYAYDGVEGNVRIRRLTDKVICLAIDVSFTRGGETVASAKGAVKAPVVRSSPTFFYT